jgi:hypothetical protein
MDKVTKFKILDKALNYLSIVAIGVLGLAAWSAWFY